MKRVVLLGFSLVLLVALAVPGYAFGAQVSDQELQQLMQTIQQLKAKVEALEKKVEQYEANQRQVAAEVQEVKQVKNDLKEKASHLERLEETLGRFEIGADLTFVGQGSMNNDDNNPDDGDTQDGAWSFDIEVSSQLWKHGTAYMLIEGGQGEGIDDEVDTLSGFNDDAPGTDSAHAEVTEAWYEQEVPLEGGGGFVFTVGKVDLTNYFDANEVANDETAQFLSSGFVNNLAVEWPEDNGLGARVTWSPREWLDLSLGWAESDSDWEDIFDDGFGIFEVGLKPNLMGMPGNYRFYVWVNAADHADVDDLKDLARGKRDSFDDDEVNWGVGFSFDQQVAKWLTLFLRGGIMDGDVVPEPGDMPVDGALSLGFQVNGYLWSRSDDIFSVAFGTVFTNDELEGYCGLPKNVADEYHLEAFYKFSFFEGKLELSPDLQVVWNPAGDDDADTVTVLGTRMQVNF